MNIIEAQGVTKTYTIDAREIHVLDDITVNVPEGEFLVIEGSSGSGKSTLLSLLSGLDHPTSGHIFVDSTDITHKTEDELAPMRNQTIGFVFQSFHLVPSLTALENITFPAELAQVSNAQDRAEALLKRVGLMKRATNFPHQLSGGEKQRVAICRALINNPKIIFADEPTGNLDSKNGEAILELMLELHAERQTTLIMVTHSAEIAQRAERVITLQDGRIVQERVPTLRSENGTRMNTDGTDQKRSGRSIIVNPTSQSL
ncbi:ABC transporter ATP-binding protein [Chloroflexi bacterium TSY]|nr:ABC transporter ATP-binding protein [Chloroflexi bacterium TSY]